MVAQLLFWHCGAWIMAPDGQPGSLCMWDGQPMSKAKALATLPSPCPSCPHPAQPLIALGPTTSVNHHLNISTSTVHLCGGSMGEFAHMVPIKWENNLQLPVVTLSSMKLLSSPTSLQGYGFPVNQLFDMLLEIQDQYSETLLKKWSGVFR